MARTVIDAPAGDSESSGQTQVLNVYVFDSGVLVTLRLDVSALAIGIYNIPPDTFR
jgi:hypothetical protein